MKLEHKKTSTPKPDDKLVFHSNYPMVLPGRRFQCPVLSCDAIWHQIDAAQSIPSCKEHGQKLVFTGLSNTPPRPVTK